MTKWLIGMALVAVVAAAGCGSGGGGDRLTKDEFISQADAICTTAHEKETAVANPNVNPSTATDDELDKFADALQEVADVNRDEIDDLKKLNPPEDFDEGYDESLKELSEALDEADNAIDEAHKGDNEGVLKALAAVEAKSNEANERAKDYGLKVCGSSS